MNEEWIQKYGQLFSTIGFSVDSVNDETNQKIGRCINTGSVISASRVTKLCELIRKYAPDCKIKINTVVTTRNRDVGSFLERQQSFVEELIKNGGDPTGNFGLDVFKKQMSGLQTPA